ncbi:hypothetical protein BGX34_001258 [Mortierella sp. NVP85]|nr:hypothetical protein BGX34_001258 [Mortierella sp. NVP85]
MTPDDSIRRLKANQEPLLPGLAYAGAAAVGGAMLVNSARSMPIKVLTPLAMATATGVYFLPAHADLIKHTWTPFLVSHPADGEERISDLSSFSTSMRDPKPSNNNITSSSSTSSSNAATDLAHQAEASWQGIKRQGEDLAENYKQAGKEQLSQMVDQPVHEAKSWLERRKEQAENIFNSSSPVAATTTAAWPPNRPQNTFHDSIPENPSSSRWSWWKRSDSMTPKSEMNNNKIQARAEDPATMDAMASSSSPRSSSSSTSERARRPSTTSTTTITTTTTTTDPVAMAAAHEPAPDSMPMEEPSKPQPPQRRGSFKPRNVLVDKAVASAAIKGHDDTINRHALLGKNTEETARKVHDNVVDAALPKHRQSPNERHDIEISRQASKSDMRDGQFIVRKTDDPEAMPQRVRRKSVQKDHHGLENLEKRASMLFKGVENLEHSINKRIQKALEEEADFWHQQSMKEEANARGGERGM